MLRSFTNLPIYFSLFFFSPQTLLLMDLKLNIFCHRMSHLTGMIFVSNIFHFSLHDFLSGFQFFFFYMIFFFQEHYFITEFQRFIFKTFSYFLQYAEIPEFFFYLFIKLRRVFFDVVSSEVPTRLHNRRLRDFTIK